MNQIDSRGGRAALMVAHCAGMLDLVTLPVWVGTLMAHYGFDEMQAGALATAFLFAAVASSLFFAPRFHKTHPAGAAIVGFGGAAAAFSPLPSVPTSRFCWPGTRSPGQRRAAH